MNAMYESRLAKFWTCKNTLSAKGWFRISANVVKLCVRSHWAWKAGDVHDHHDKTTEKTATPEPVADRFKSVRQEADLTHNHKKGHML